MMQKIIALSACSLLACGAQQPEQTNKLRTSRIVLSPGTINAMRAQSIETTAEKQQETSAAVSITQIAPDALAKITAKECSAAATHPLDVVTIIKPLQRIIIGYLGMLNLRENSDKNFNGKKQNWNCVDASGKTIRELCGDADFWKIARCFSSTTFMGLYAHAKNSGYSAYHKNTAHKFEVSNNRTLVTVIPEVTNGDVSDLQISDSGEKLLANTYIFGSRDYVTQMWHIPTGVLTHTLKTNQALLSPEGKYLLYTPEKTQDLVMLDLTTSEHQIFLPDFGSIREAIFSKDGTKLVMVKGTGCTIEETVRFFDIIKHPLL